MMKMSSNINNIEYERQERHVISLLVENQAKILDKMKTFCETVLNDLNQYGICVIDDFLGDIGDNVLQEVVALYKAGVFKEGQLVKANEYARVIRKDQITWVDGTEPHCQYIGFLIQTLDSIVMRCNTMPNNGALGKYKINRRTKAMIACYPGNGTNYVKHIDNPNQDGRCITSIYYLNKNYIKERDHGELRIFCDYKNQVADIEPKFDRIIFFWSDRRNPHEVQPSFRIRFAITVWYFDAEERERALKDQQQKQNGDRDKDLRPFDTSTS